MWQSHYHHNLANWKLNEDTLRTLRFVKLSQREEGETEGRAKCDIKAAYSNIYV